MKKILLSLFSIFYLATVDGQVRTSVLYVTGTVNSDEKMLVTVRETKYIEGKVVNAEGKVVTAELNGKKTEARTNSKGQAILDFSAITGGLVGTAVAVIKSYDKNGQLLATANSTIQHGSPGIARPVIEQLPKNLSNGEAVTITGKNLGTEAKLFCGRMEQETLAASDKEMTVLTRAKTGDQSSYVITPNGVSESRMTNIYSLDFALAKNSIMPKENVQAMVHYESIPVGTKLIFTNKSPQTITMKIPGAQNTANECIYTVAEKNGSIPVNITGLTRGDFTIALDPNFKDEKENNPPQNLYDNEPPAGAKPLTLADSLKIKTDAIAGMEELAKDIKKTGNKKEDKAGVLDNLVTSINQELATKAIEQKILVKNNNEYDFNNLERNEPGKDLKTARSNLEIAIAEEEKALVLKKAALDKLNAILKTIPDLKTKTGSAKNDEIEADKKKDGTKANKKEAENLKKDAAKKEKEVSDKLADIGNALADIKKNINDAKAAVANAVTAKNNALENIKDYNKTQDEKTRNNANAAKIAKDLSNTIESLKWEDMSLAFLSLDIGKLKDKCAGIKDGFDKLVEKK